MEVTGRQGGDNANRAPEYDQTNHSSPKSHDIALDIARPEICFKPAILAMLIHCRSM